MAPSTRETVSVRLRERQLVETILALRVRALERMNTASVAAVTSAIELFERALRTLQGRP